jgi:glycosyltransferase involved in cell wall biosynthesis
LTLATADTDSPDRRHLEQRVREHGLERRTSFTTGAAPDQMARIYASADVLLFPSEWPEPWGLVPLEAMAQGLPVVATAVGGAAEYLAHEQNALVVEPRDADAMLTAVTRLRDDADLRAHLIRGGRATAARFSTENVATDIERVMFEAIARRRAS